MLPLQHRFECTYVSIGHSIGSNERFRNASLVGVVIGQNTAHGENEFGRFICDISLARGKEVEWIDLWLWHG